MSNEMQIAGETCMVCGKKIIFSRDGKYCQDCRIVVHQTCDPENTCTKCGRAYQTYEPPIADPAREAVVPRSLRPSGSSGPIAIVIFSAVLLFFMLLLLLVWFAH